ncbi:MAG: 2-hydroxyacyl-CoA dehydratase subunit D [Promethearchaeota archaeon]
MVEKKNLKSKTLDATKGLKFEMARHYLAIEYAIKKGKPTAWATSGSPVELLYAMDVQPMLPENSATISAAKARSKEFIEIAEDEGFSYDLCSYFKTNIGVTLSETTDIEVGGIKKPTFMLSSDVICDTHVNWFQVQAERYNVPHFTIDVPHVVSNTSNKQKNYYKDYVTGQLWEFIDFVQAITGHKWDEQRVKEVAENSFDLSKAWQDIFELRKGIPSPLSTKDTFGGLFPLFTMPGLKSPIDLYKSMYEEAKQRLDDGVGALAEEKYRLMFEGIPFWYNLKFFNFLEQYGAIIVYEPYTYGFSKYLDPSITKEVLLKKPIEIIAELMLSFWYIYDLKTRIQKFQETIKEWSIDGVILHNNLSCRPNSCGMYDLKKHLMEDSNIPCLIIDGDMNDPRKLNTTQTTNKIESFLELLDKQKKR